MLKINIKTNRSLLAILLSVTLQTALPARIPQAASHKESVSSSSAAPFAQDMQKLFTSPTVQDTLKCLQIRVYQKLNPGGSKPARLKEFFGFLSRPEARSTFSKWPHVCSDFIEELTKTMPVDDILEKFGLNQKDLSLPVAAAPLSSSPAEEAAKDGIITTILKNSRLSALASLASFGIGYIASFIKTKKITDKDKHQAETEERMQSALRYALKRNLSLSELKYLQAFSLTEAFTVLVDNLEDFKLFFIETLTEKDPELLINLMEKIQARAGKFFEEEAGSDTITNAEEIAVVDPVTCY